MERMVDAIATGYLVAGLKSICAREFQPLLDPDEETSVRRFSVVAVHRLHPNTPIKMDAFARPKHE
jgi:hypothetical protein